MITPYINLEAEEYFQNLADNRDALTSCYQHICDTLNQALSVQDYDAMLSLIPYMESGEGHLAFEHIGETRRILRVLNIISLEHKYLGETFASDCACMEEIMRKYYLTLFAFRRLLFQLSDASVEEAVEYLQGTAISHFAVYIITSEELMHATSEFFEIMANVYALYWDEVAMQQFQMLVAQTS